jgi:hypothetical protein
MPDHAESFLLPVRTSHAHAVEAKTWRLNRIARRAKRPSAAAFKVWLGGSGRYFGAQQRQFGFYPQAAQKWLEWAQSMRIV